MVLDCASCSEIQPCPKCGPAQVCAQSYPSDCSECPKNICVDAGHLEKELNPAAIIGGAVGGFVGFLVLLALGAGVWQRKRRSRVRRAETPYIDLCDSPDVQCAAPVAPAEQKTHCLSCISEHTEPEEMEPNGPPIVKADGMLCVSDEHLDNPFAGVGKQCACGKQGVRLSSSGTVSALCESCAALLYTSIPLVPRHIRFVPEQAELERFPSVHKQPRL